MASVEAAGSELIRLRLTGLNLSGAWNAEAAHLSCHGRIEHRARLGARVAGHGHDRRGAGKRAPRIAAIAEPAIGLAQRAVDAFAAIGAKVRNRDHEIRDRIALGVDLAMPLVFARDLEHLVLDDIAQVERLKDQGHRTLER